MPLLNIPEEVIELRNTLRDFIEREIRPTEESHRQEILDTGTFDGLKEESLKLRKRSAELGFYTLHMPEEVGGGGLSYLGQVILHEEAARSGLILPQVESIFPVISGPSPIYMDCTEQQREKYLDPLLRADKTTCFALTEPGAGSDATRIQTKAVREGSGSWRLNGRKHFITGGGEAEFALVFAVTDPEKRAKGGITAFFVDADKPGYEVSRVQRTMSPFQNPVEMTFTDVEVTDAEILGKEGYGFYSAMRGINGARLQIAARALGLARYMLDRSIEYANDRTAFGRPIGANQFVQGMIVESHAELEQARLLVYLQASEIDDGADGRK
jgi:alkylation response protein AidB-like acyl-CoA dehydrogenase